MTTPHAPDDERLPGEDELSSLYRKLPRIEPPAALDAAVRRAAADAVKPAVAPRRRAHWPVALSSAAALVLAAGLAWRMGQMPGKQDELREAAAQHEARTVAPQEPAATQPTAALQAPPPRIVQQTKPSPPDGLAHLAQAQVRQKRATPPEPPPAVEEASSHPVPAPAVLAPAPMPAPAPPPAPPSPPAPPTEIVDHAAQVDRIVQQSPTPTQAYSRRPATAPMAQQAMPAPVAPPMAEEAMAAPVAAPDLRFNKSDTPELELVKIRGLFLSNRREEARTRLADFHRDHPNYELPTDLRDQLLQP